MRLAFLIALGGLLLAGGFITIATVSGPAVAGDPVGGRKIASMCSTCHGTDGYARVPIAPHIGGEAQEYLEAQLIAYKTGKREHEMMSLVAASLTEQQISDVAAWYASHIAVATLPDGIDAGDAPQACVACHGANGISQLPDAPNLAGETNIYIDTQLKAFKRGHRQHEVMSEVAADLSDREIRALADWYAAVTLEIKSPPQ